MYKDQDKPTDNPHPPLDSSQRTHTTDTMSYSFSHETPEEETYSPRSPTPSPEAPASVYSEDLPEGRADSPAPIPYVRPPPIDRMLCDPNIMQQAAIRYHEARQAREQREAEPSQEPAEEGELQYPIPDVPNPHEEPLPITTEEQQLTNDPPFVYVPPYTSPPPMFAPQPTPEELTDWGLDEPVERPDTP
jgi:hypothetical protein